jgi:YebC/PmpR family DNA-binding regulatory protein
MSGHNKWANIKHRKGAQDAKKGKIYTKIIKEITIAAKTGGADASANPRLRIAIDKAKSNNMPKDTIERALKKGTGELEGVNYEELTYEGYGTDGVAILIDIMTDNKNRTSGEIRNILSKNGGAMAEAGAVAWNFERKGEITITGVKEDDVMELAIENGADDVSSEGNEVYVTTEPENFMALKEALEKKFKVESAELTKIPKNLVKIENKESAEKILKILDLIEDHDDVQKVYANIDMDDSLMGE